MPVIKSAKKKLRQDRKRQTQNKGVRNQLKSLLKKAHAEKSEKAIIAAIQVADKAAKKHIIHKNKAARIKSTLAKLTAQKITVKAKSAEAKVKKTPKATQAKTSATV